MNGNNKKLIFYIDSLYRGGANRVIANLANCFAEDNYSVVVINDVRGDESNEYPLNNTIKRIILLDDKKKHNGISKFFLRLKRLRKTIKLNKPYAVVSFMGPPNIRMLISSFGIKTRKIVSVRNDPLKEYGKGLKKFFANFIFGFADGVVFQTEQASLYFKKRIRKKSRVILNQVNPVFYNQKLNKEEPNIIFVGRLQTQKNPLLLFKAFQLIKDDFPKYRLLYFGEGNLLAALKEAANENGLSDRVLFLGQTSNVALELSTASCFVLCSDYEGLPNALMEAMAVGVPVISTDCPCGGPRALIKNEDQGILIKCGDNIALSDALRRVLSSEEIRQKMRNSAKERALDFRPTVIFNQWKEYILGKN